MAFLNFPSPTPVFPQLPIVTFPVEKVPNFLSLSAIKASGVDVRARRQVFPIWEFVLKVNGLREATQNQIPDPFWPGFRELELISMLFVKCRGSYGEFYYNDPTDNSQFQCPLATAGTAVAPALGLKPTTDGVSTQFIPMRAVGIPSLPLLPNFLSTFEPVGGIASVDGIFVAGTSAPYGAPFVVSGNMIVFTTPPPSGLQLLCDTHFYYRCRFSSDAQDYEQFMNDLWQLGECRFRSVKP